MFKKISIILILLMSSCVLFVSAEESIAPEQTSSFNFGSDMHMQTPLKNGNFGSVPLHTYAGRFFGWLMCGENTAAKTAVTGLLTYCVAYTLYQTAKGVGSTVWTWWKGEHLSSAMQRQVEIAVTDLIRKNGMGQMAIYRNPHHHEDGVCTCVDCLASIRTRS